MKQQNQQKPPKQQMTSGETAPDSFSFVAPRHPDGSDWPWISRIGPMRRHRFTPIYIENTFNRVPRATRFYVRWQYLRAMRAIRRTELAFLFSTEIGVGMTSWPSKLLHQPKRIYVGFTQDGPWPQPKIDRLSRALRQCDAVTVFSEDERRLYLQRYALNSARVHLIPIHTDETQGYKQYSDARPIEAPYVLSLGSPNRRFTPIARACAALKIPLVIITRAWHKNDSLAELADLGATIITDADKMKSLTYLKHAKFAAMCFETPELPGAFTTLIHAMFMRTPSVVTSCLGISDYIVDGENGIVTPHGDDAALQRAIDQLWNQPGFAERFAQAGYARAVRLFSLEAAAEQFDALAENVLRQPRQ